MSVSLRNLAESELGKLNIDEKLGFFHEQLEMNELTIEICDVIRSRILTLLKADKKRPARAEKSLPDLEKTPYVTLITKICEPNFKQEKLTPSERAILGFIPVDVDKKRVGDLLKIVAGTVASTFYKSDEDAEFIYDAKKSTYAGLVVNLDRGLDRTFNEIPIDLGFLKKDLAISPKSLGTLIQKLKAEGKTSTEDLLLELGFSEEEIPNLNEKMIEAGKEAIIFYRKVGKEIADGQRRFVSEDKMGVLRGTLAKIDPYLEDSQADLFALLDKSYSRDEIQNDEKTGISRKYEAQILLWVRYLHLMIAHSPVYKALINSTELLSKFSHNLLKDTGEESIEIDDYESENTIDTLSRIITVRTFEKGMPPIYIDDVIREKEWDSIMLKIITGESSSENIADMLAGQGAIYGINKEDLIVEDGCEDFEKIETINERIEYIERICVKTAEAMGCMENLSNEDLSEKGTDYHHLLPGQFKIVKKIHGDANNEKSHNFSAFKIYMAVKSKTGATLRIEWRYVPWDTYLSSKSKTSLSSDAIYSLKKKLIFSKYAIRKSQNERFINVVERLLEVLSELEEKMGVIRKNGDTSL